MNLFSRKEKEELVLVFDIGSSSVGGALFYMQSSGVPKIIFSTREPIPLETEINSDRFFSSTASTLEILAGKISLAKLGAPKKIFCVLSSPWYAMQIRVIKLEKNDSFVFTSKLADSLIKKEVDLFEEEYVMKYHQGTVKRIELKNIKTSLNGYHTTEPLGQTAKELEMNVFISISPEEVLRKIENAIGRHFNSKNITFSSLALASFAVARDLFSNQDDFLLVDIGGELTDILMSKKDIMRESISYPLGNNSLIRSIASSLGLTLAEARSLFSMYKENHADDITIKKLEPIMNDFKKEWLKNFQESLVNFSNDLSIPSTVIITAGKTSMPFFGEIIKSEQFNQYTLTESKFKLVFLDTETLHGIASFSENSERDSFLTIESIYINRFLNQK